MRLALGDIDPSLKASRFGRFQGVETPCSLRSASAGDRDIRVSVLKLFEVRELFHQLFHAVAVEHDGKFGVFAFAFAHEDGAFSVLGVDDALAFFEVGGAGGRRDVHGGAGEVAGFPRKGVGSAAEFAGSGLTAEEAGYVVDGLRVLLLRGVGTFRGWGGILG